MPWIRRPKDWTSSRAPRLKRLSRRLKSQSPLHGPGLPPSLKWQPPFLADVNVSFSFTKRRLYPDSRLELTPAGSMMSDHQTRGGPHLSPKWGPSRPSRPPLCFLCYIHGRFLAECLRLPVTLQRAAVEKRATYERKRDPEETRSLPPSRFQTPRSRRQPAPRPAAREVWPPRCWQLTPSRSRFQRIIRALRVTSHPEMGRKTRREANRDDCQSQFKKM
jgi:hypothetical protein